jgi:cytochrome P450
VSDLALEEAHVRTLLKALPLNDQGSTGTVDLQPMIFRLTLDSASEFLFGESAKAQEAALERRPGVTYPSDVMLAGYEEASHIIAIRARLGDAFWLYSPKSLYKASADVHRWADDLVAKVLQEEKSASSDQRQGYKFLHELTKETQDKEFLRSQLLNIMIAGRDSTASLICWTMHFMALHPHIYERLRNSIIADFGAFDDTDLSSGSSGKSRFSFEALKSNRTLQHILQETLRLYPPVPLNTRIATRDTTWPTGGGPDGKQPVLIRKGQEIGYYIYMMHRRKDLWGEDALEFNPDRWIDRRPGWEYLPFNGGPRICIGQQFALTEAGYVIARLCQRFERCVWRGQGDGKNPRHLYKVTDAPAEVLVELHAA